MKVDKNNYSRMALAIVIMILLIPCISSKNLSVQDAGIIPKTSFYEKDILTEQGNLEVSLALVFYVDKNYHKYPDFDVNIYFDGIEPMPHKFPLEPEITICEGQSFYSYLNEHCNISYQLSSKTINPLNKGYEYIYTIKHDDLKIGKSYAILVKYSIPQFVNSWKIGSHYLFFIDNACKSTFCSKIQNTQTIFLPKATSLLEEIDPKPDNVSYVIENKKQVLTFNNSTRVFIKFIDTHETENLIPLWWMFLGALIGGLLEIFLIERIVRVKKWDTKIEKLLKGAKNA